MCGFFSSDSKHARTKSRAKHDVCMGDPLLYNLEHFISHGLRNEDGLDLDLIKSTAVAMVKHLRSNRDEPAVDLVLERRWYDALEQGHIDWSVYNDALYLSELWSCWMIYSKRYLHDMQMPNKIGTKSIMQDVGEVERVVDLGCGFAYTTAVLKSMYPDADVVGTNLAGTMQTRVAKRVAKEYGFTVATKLSMIKSPVDLIFASEYFEHIQDPIEHLHEVLDVLTPKCLIMANSFNTSAIGHFSTYLVDGRSINQSKIARIFNDELRRRGYQKMSTKLWNNRPMYWKRQNNRQSSRIRQIELLMS